MSTWMLFDSTKIDVFITSSSVAWYEQDGESRSTIEPKAQHLSCFAGGMVALGAKMFEHTEDISVARKLVDGCIWGYDSAPLGIMPEVMYIVACEENEDYPKQSSQYSSYTESPVTQSAQKKAWTMFNNIIQHTVTDIAHAGLDDCTIPHPSEQDRMESFWLAETPKYFYLIFSEPDVGNLGEYVLNTERINYGDLTDRLKVIVVIHT
ncbi:endoplasmic reticulum mannosyl-oligosaccharide 1,2-alpha-mannosidase, putative [Talaromyces stipitatus ATCC 10500]|uniref:alpha-1,2-Mannosidase n=1 Tax=Talaromyces stipitatus (strain ATCC 10500 / CBS 375.48 / QM 6759 / NRRL 1006) TaxID=441959 RepID=B8MH84_TALSN|nr:endoplasmic reticulum mannosyl-oligosaccharide 1,2-alpha-mannosidase, putative [Talaromyces stipitatus ATCC 10500]EED16898.1 endoplasmic reticulum mannosyl-oligosaccharide 1,2-alpha-mannosidase, putative [Talaromyces stipitatus ATCC 10500]